MHTFVQSISPYAYPNYLALVSALMPHLSWRHSGLGMLQAYVKEGTDRELRVHIWHPSLRRKGIEESGLVHDHRFALDSHVLIGCIKQVEYTLTPNPKGAWIANRVLHARAAADQNLNGPERLVGTFHSEPERLAERYDVKTEAFLISEGSRYRFPKREFHGTYFENDLAVTLVEKFDQDEVPARILSPHDKPIVHAFEKPLPRERWEHVLYAAKVALNEKWKSLGRAK